MKIPEKVGSKKNDGNESRNPSSGRRMRDRTPGRRIRAKTPVKLSSRAMKNREKNRENEEKPHESTRSKNPQNSRLHTRKVKTTTPNKTRDKTPGRGRRAKSTTARTSKKKTKAYENDVPPRSSDEENRIEVDPSEPDLKKKTTPRPSPEESQHKRKKETKKKSQYVESSMKNRQRRENEEIEVVHVHDESKCSSIPILKNADDAVLSIGSYFGRGIVAIVDGVRYSNCIQGKPPSSVMDKFSCAAPGTFDTGVPIDYESLTTKTKRGYLYDDEGNHVA